MKAGLKVLSIKKRQLKKEAEKLVQPADLLSESAAGEPKPTFQCPNCEKVYKTQKCFDKHDCKQKNNSERDKFDDKAIEEELFGNLEESKAPEDGETTNKSEKGSAPEIGAVQ